MLTLPGFALGLLLVRRARGVLGFGLVFLALVDVGPIYFVGHLEPDEITTGRSRGVSFRHSKIAFRSGGLMLWTAIRFPV